MLICILKTIICRIFLPDVQNHLPAAKLFRVGGERKLLLKFLGKILFPNYSQIIFHAPLDIPA
jgi:hypothetical protein